MRYDLAPLEGITGPLYRRTHHQIFGGADRYYTPFLSPGEGGTLNKRELRDIAPEENQGLPLVPQLLTRRSGDFIGAARRLGELGYQHINLNLGCPSGTVTAKGKGSGFLAHPQELDHFLEEIFSAALPVKISVKSRLGMTSEEEFPPILAIFEKYPLEELILHPRVRQDLYRKPVRPQAFRWAAEHTSLPLCYNGDLVTAADCARMEQEYPMLRGLMLGRGAIADPAVFRKAKGGKAARREELRLFHDTLHQGYCQAFQSPKNAICRMKDVWRCMIFLFEDEQGLGKALRKATEPADYQWAVEGIFRLPLREDAKEPW